MHRHTQHNGVKVIAEEGHQRRISRLQVLSQTRSLLTCKRKLYRPAFIQCLTEVEELLGCSTHDAVRTACGLYITAGEGLLVIHNECQESREITVLDRWHERFVLAERTREQHTQLRARDTRIIVRAVTGDRFVLRGFAERRVVVRHRRTPYIGNNRSLALMDVPAAVLTLQLLVETRVRRVTGDNQRLRFVYFANQLQRQVRDTLAASCRTDDKALKVRIVLLARQSVAEIKIRHAASRRCQQRHQ